jgi:hypothetical protein
VTQPVDLPLLLMAEPVAAGREPLGQARPGRGVRRPDAATQGQRLGGKWQALADAMEQQRARLAPTLDGVDPELVLVLEIATSIDDFARAVRRIPGFEFLAELDEDAIDDPEDVFAPDTDDETAADVAIPGTMFLMATNQQALAGVLDLWLQYQADENASFPYGMARWRDVFRYLLDVRRWSAQDRLRGTGATQDFAQRVAAGQEVVPAELELWYRADAQRRQQAEATVSAAIDAADGRVIARADIPGIAYHALLVELPVTGIDPVLQGAPDDVALLRVEELAFVRPQSLVLTAREEELSASAGPTPSGAATGDPLVAMLDGVPLLGHRALAPYVTLDDPDDIQANTTAAQRQHGTAMASAIIHGDLSASGAASLRRPVYARPVLVPDTMFDGRVVERIPADQLAVDLIHRAVVRMFEGEAGAAPTASSVRVINLSLGDASNPLATTLSPWARLLDWLSHRYGVVFVVSAGNHPALLELPFSLDELQRLDERQRRRATLRALSLAAHQRRLLSPAESVNALTVGASHDDSSASPRADSRVDLFPGAAAGVEAPPSPISSIGLGYRKGIKPDLLAPGGRLLYRPDSPLTSRRPSVLRPQASPSAASPGIEVAAPGSGGVLNHTWFMHGTSIAAALTTHHLASLLEVLETLRDNAGRTLQTASLGVLAKTLAVHSARIPRGGRAELESVLSDTIAPRKMRAALARFYGYGLLNPRRLAASALTRVTLLGAGTLLPEQGHRYSVPLPPALSGYAGDRTLTITVASLVPVRARDHRHRAAEVYFVPDTTSLVVARQDADSTLVRKGAVQHEVLHGSQAAVFSDGDELAITVSCRSLVGTHREPSMYGIAVTLEVPEHAQLPLYTQIEARVRQQVAIRARVQNPS